MVTCSRSSVTMGSSVTMEGMRHWRDGVGGEPQESAKSIGCYAGRRKQCRCVLECVVPVNEVQDDYY
jgi:hypothetical protein